MISSRLAPRLSAPRACSATSFGQSEPYWAHSEYTSLPLALSQSRDVLPEILEREFHVAYRTGVFCIHVSQERFARVRVR